MAISEQEKRFGDALHEVVVHLIKNAVKVPKPVIECAIAHEKHRWSSLPDSEKNARLQDVFRLTLQPSAVHQHFQAFPHAFGKSQYEKYLAAAEAYRAQLNL